MFNPKTLTFELMLAMGTLFLSIKEISAQNAMGEYYIHGKITGTNAQGLEGIEVKRILYNDSWPFEVDTQIVITDADGYFNTIYTSIEDGKNNSVIGNIKYYKNTIEVPGDASLKIFNILGQEIKSINLVKGVNALSYNTFSNGVYIFSLDINNNLYTNKLLKLDQSFFIGSSVQYVKPVKSFSKNSSRSNPYLYFAFELKDTNDQFYRQKFQAWNGYYLTSTDVEHNMPLLKKKILQYPFINDRNGEAVNTTKDFLFYQMGTDFLPTGHACYFNFVKPILIDLNIDELPAQYTETQLRDGTNYMLQLSGFPLDSTLYKETNAYINPFDTTNSVINYLYLDNTEMQGYDIVQNIFRRSDETQSFEFWFNIDTIEPEYFQKAVQLSWQKTVSTPFFTPNANYHSQGLRNNVNTLLEDEIIPYTYCFQQEHRMWIGPETIVDGAGTNATLNHIDYTSTTPEIIQYKIKFDKDKTIIDKEFIGMDKYEARQNRVQ